MNVIIFQLVFKQKVELMTRINDKLWLYTTNQTSALVKYSIVF